MKLFCFLALLLVSSLPGKAQYDQQNYDQQYAQQYGQQYSHYVNHDRILLTSIQALTFHEGQMTTGRRSSPVMQLVCVGSNCRPEWTPSSVQCMNVGDDGYDVQWECKAELENAVKFGPVTVICEGYDNPDDPYVLRGSCQLEYSLKRTLNSPSPAGNNYGNQHTYSYDYKYDSRESSPWTSLFLFLIVAFFIYKCCFGARRPAEAGMAGGMGGPGGGYGGPGGPGYPGSPGYPPNCGPGYPVPGNPAGGGGGPGFWGGMGLGGIMGYLGGRQNYGGGYRPRNTHRFSTGSSGMSSRPSSSSSGTRTTSGYGGTRRR